VARSQTERTETMKYARKAWEVAGYAYHASLYCAPCGGTLPETDPEGNDKHPVFVGDSMLGAWTCEKCDLPATEW